jgi:hypothetical protein
VRGEGWRATCGCLVTLTRRLLSRLALVTSVARISSASYTTLPV